MLWKPWWGKAAISHQVSGFRFQEKTLAEVVKNFGGPCLPGVLMKILDKVPKQSLG
jgi:hypothetical protein